MAALLVALTIMAIMMTVAMPTWKQMSRREKEAELVFRGEQYARALMLFQMKNGPGTSPPSIDFLVEQRFLRKKYKDPITNDEFVPVVQMAGQVPGQSAPPDQGARGAAGQPSLSPASASPAASTRPGVGASQAGAIIGFTSKSKEQSIRLYNGRNHYNEWLFMPAMRVAAPEGAGGRQGGPGGSGQGGQPSPQAPQGQPPPFGGRGPIGPGQPAAPGAPSGPGRGAQPFGPFRPGGR